MLTPSSPRARRVGFKGVVDIRACGWGVRLVVEEEVEEAIGRALTRLGSSLELRNRTCFVAVTAQDENDCGLDKEVVYIQERA